MTHSAILKNLRDENKLTKAEMARRLKITHQSYSSLESRESNPTVKTLDKIAARLGYALELKFTKNG